MDGRIDPPSSMHRLTSAAQQQQAAAARVWPGSWRTSPAAAPALGLPVLRLRSRFELTVNHAPFARLGFRRTADPADQGYSRPTLRDDEKTGARWQRHQVPDRAGSVAGQEAWPGRTWLSQPAFCTGRRIKAEDLRCGAPLAPPVRTRSRRRKRGPARPAQRGSRSIPPAQVRGSPSSLRGPDQNRFSSLSIRKRRRNWSIRSVSR